MVALGRPVRRAVEPRPSHGARPGVRRTQGRRPLGAQDAAAPPHDRVDRPRVRRRAPRQGRPRPRPAGRSRPTLDPGVPGRQPLPRAVVRTVAVRGRPTGPRRGAGAAARRATRDRRAERGRPRRHPLGHPGHRRGDRSPHPAGRRRGVVRAVAADVAATPPDAPGHPRITHVRDARLGRTRHRRRHAGARQPASAPLHRRRLALDDRAPQRRGPARGAGPARSRPAGARRDPVDDHTGRAGHTGPLRLDVEHLDHGVRPAGSRPAGRALPRRGPRAPGWDARGHRHGDRRCVRPGRRPAAARRSHASPSTG